MFKVGDYLKQLRESKNIKASEVWKAVCINDSVLSNLENNKTAKPDPTVLKKLAEYYNINPIQLFVLAGYLDEPLSSYAFNGLDKLSDKEIHHIQELINLFNENRLEKR